MKVTLRRSLLMALIVLMVVGCMVFGVGAASVDVTAADLQAAINNADGATTVKLTNDVELTETLTVPAGKEITLDLNGKKVTGANGATINSKGGLTIGDSVGGGAVLCDVAKEGTEAFLEVWGGTFSTDVSEYCATGYEAVQANGAWRVKFEIEALNKNTNKKYKTLAEAIAAAAPGQTVVLQGVVVIDSNLTIDKDVTISDYGSLSIAFVNGAGIYLKGNVALTVDQIVLSNVQVWSDAVNAGATVNGDPVTGVDTRPSVLNCDADSFALVNPVWGAKVVSANGTAYYESFAQALAAAEKGETVVMLENVNASEIVTINKAITLDGNGKTLTSTAGRAINVDCNGEVTIKNLTVVASGERAINVINKSVQLTLDNVTATAANYAVNVAASAGAAKITVKNSTLTGLNVVNVTSVGADVAVIDTVLNCNDNTAAEGYGALVLNPDATNAKITATRVTFNISGDSAQAINSAVNGSISGTDNKGDDVLVAHSVAIIRYSNGTAYAFFTFAEALEKVKDGETIILLDVEGTESGDLTFDKNISFTITGYAPNYALPVVTFQNATVTIKDATILIPELDARQNATINVIDSIVHDAGSDSIAKSYFNGAINISGSSVVYMMQVTTMGYITVSGNAKLNATWQTNVYGNGMIVVKDNATFATAALQLTGKDYSDRDNTDADRVGKPATIVVDGASFIVGNVKSESGADYSYNSSKGINVGTIAGKAAVLDVKNGATVAIYMANGETANIGADGVVNVNASTFTVACRGEGDVTLTNSGKVSVSGVSKLSIPTLSGEGDFDFLDGAIITNSTIGGGVFVAGKVVFRGANTFGMIYDYGTLTDYYGTTANMEWSVEVGASVTLTETARYGLGYGDKVTVYGSLSDALNARETLTGNDKALFMHGLVAQESEGWNCDSSFTAKDAYIIIGSNNSFGNKPGNYGGTYTFSFDNVVLDASRITFYEALSNTTLTFNNTDAKVGTFMTRDQDSEFVLINTKLLSTTTFNGNDEGNYHAGKLTLSNSTLTYSAPLVMEGGVLTVGADSKLTAPAITGTGKIVIDATGMRAGVVTTVEADLSGYTGEIEVINNNAVYAAIVNGKIVLVKNTIKIGNAYYKTLAEALAAAQNGDVVELLWAEGDAPIAMNGSVYGKTVTITGTATVDWSKGFLFIGRGGEGNGTVIFDNSKLTSASDQATYGIHVSGREKNTTNKYDGTLVIKNSTIELDYLINKGAMTLDASTLTVKNGFSIGGRPASETESGEDATATLDLTNGSKVVVNNHNGMGLGYEAIGVMNIDATSAFETTQAFLVTAKGTMNIAGTVKIAGTLTNKGAMLLDGAIFTADMLENVKDSGATFEAKDATVLVNKLKNNVAMFIGGNMTIKVEDATGSSYAIRANDGVVFNNSYIKGTANETVRLLGSATFNGGFVCSYLQGSSAGVGGTVTIEANTVVKATYGVEFSADYVLNGGTIELSGGNASGKLWGCVFQNGTYTINTDIVVNSNGSTAPIYFTDAIATVNATITQRNSGGEPLYIGSASVVTFGANAVINTLSVHGAGKLILDATGMTAGEYANVKCGASGFTGGIEVINNNAVYAAIVDGKIVLVSYVAKIGEQGYKTLADALAAAKDGDVVTLLCDTTVDETMKVNADITIDLNGKTVTATSKKAFEVYANVTIKNGAIVAANRCVDTRVAVELTLINVALTADKYTTAYGNPQPLTIGGAENGTKVAMTNVTINAGTAGYAIITFVKTELTAEASSLTGYIALQVLAGSEGSKFTFTNTALTNDLTTNDVEGNSAGILNVCCAGVTVTVAGGSMTAKGNHAYAMVVEENGFTAAINTTISGNILAYTAAVDLTENVISISKANADELRAQGYAYTTPVNGMVTVRGEAIAEINGFGYVSLEEALAAAKDGETVDLLKDVTAETDNLNIETDITLDGHGFKVTSKAPNGKAGLRVRDAEAVIKNLVLETVNDTADAFVLAHKSVNPGTYAKATLIDCEIISKHHGLYIYKAKEADLVVSNTKITVGYAGVYVRETAKGTVDIQSGTKIESTGTGTGAYGVQSQLSVVDITLEAGSSVKAANGALYFNGKGANGTMTVKGNAIVEGGNYDVYATQEVSSYTFNYSESTRYAAVVFSDWATGTYNGVSRNAGQAYHLYESLESAFSATETYVIGTITVSLLKDVTASATITVAYSCTIYGNGHKISYTGEGFAFDIKAANVTFVDVAVEALNGFFAKMSASTNFTVKDSTVKSKYDLIQGVKDVTVVITLDGTRMENTEGASSGIYILNDTADYTIKLTNASTLIGRGPAISLNSSTGKIIAEKGSVLQGVTGNGITVRSVNFTLEMSDSTMTGNGSAVSFADNKSKTVNVTITGSELEAATGHAFALGDAATFNITIVNSTLNALKGKGVSVGWNSVASVLKITDSEINAYVEALALRGDVTATVIGTTITGTKKDDTDSNNRAIYVHNRTKLTMTDCVVNADTTKAVAIHSANDSNNVLTFNNVEFNAYRMINVGNGSQGFALYMTNCDVNMTDRMLYIDKTTKETNSIVDIKGTTITCGGTARALDIRNQNLNLTISDSTITAYGDVVYMECVGTIEILVSHSTLTSSNWAGLHGNACAVSKVTIVGTLSEDANGKPVSTTTITGGSNGVYFRGNEQAEVVISGAVIKATDVNSTLSNAVKETNADGTPKSWKQNEQDVAVRLYTPIDTATSGKLTITNSYIESAARGVMATGKTQLTMNGVELKAYLEGVYMDSVVIANIKDSTLTVTGVNASLGNYHTWDGSNRVIYMNGTPQLTVVDSTLNYNGTLGSIIYLADGSSTKISMTGCSVNSNAIGLMSGGSMVSNVMTLDDVVITSVKEGIYLQSTNVVSLTITGASAVKSTNAAAIRLYLDDDHADVVHNITIALDAMGDEPSIWGKTYGIQNHNYGNYNYTFVNAWVQGDTLNALWKSTHVETAFAGVAEFNLTATASRFVGAGDTSVSSKHNASDSPYALNLFHGAATSKMTVVLNDCDFGGTWTTDANGNVTSFAAATHWGINFHGLEGSSLTINGGVYLSKNDNLKLFDYVDVKINDAFVGSNGGWMVTYNHSGAGACSMLIENSVLNAAGKAINFTGGANTVLKSIVIKDSYIEAGGAEGIQIQTPYAGDEIIVDISNTTLFSTNTWALSVNTSDASVATSKVHVTLTNCNFGGSKAADGTVTAASHKGVRFEGANGSTFTIDGGYYYTNHDGFLFRDYVEISFANAETYLNAANEGWGIFYQAINDLAGAASMYFENCNVVARSRAVSYDGSIASFMNGLTLINTNVKTRGTSNAITVKSYNVSEEKVTVIYRMDKTIAAQGAPTIDAGGYGTCFVTATALELDFKNVWIKSGNDCFNVDMEPGSTDLTLTFADGKLDCTRTSNNTEGWAINVYGDDADVTVNVTNTDFSGKSGIKCDPTGNGTRTVNVIGNENGGNTMVLGGRVLQIGQNVTMVVENYDIDATGMLGNDTWCIMYAKSNANLTLKNVDFDAEIGRDSWKGVRAIHLANGSSVTLTIIDSTVTSNKVAIRTSMDHYDKSEATPNPDDADLNTTTIVLRNSTIEANERFGIYLNGKNASFFRLTLDNSKVINHYDGHDLKKDVYGYAILADDFRSEITITGDSLIEANGAFMTAIRIGGGAAGTINMTGGKIVADWAAIEMDYGYNESYGPNNGYGQLTLNINLPESARNTPSIVSRNWHAMWLKGVAYQNTTMSNVYVQAHSNVVHRGNHTNASVDDYSKNVTDVWQYCKFVSTGDPSVNDADAGLYYSLLNNDGAYAKYDLTLFHCEVYGREYGIGISGRPGAGSVLNIVGGKIGGEYTFVDYFTGETHTYSAQHGILVGGEVTINVNGELADDPTTAVVGDKYVPTSAKDRVTIGGTTTGIILKKSTTTTTLNLKYADISGNQGIFLDHATASSTYWNLTGCTVTATEEVLTKDWSDATKVYVVATNTTLTCAGGAGDKRAVYMGGHFHLTMDNSKIYYNNATGNAFYFANDSGDLNLTMRNGSLIESLGGGIHAGGEANSMVVNMDDSHIKSAGITVYFGTVRPNQTAAQSLTMTGTSTLYSSGDYAIKAYPRQASDAMPLTITMNMDKVGDTPHIYGKTRGISIHNHCNVVMELTNAYIGTDGDHAIWKSGHKMEGVGEVTFVLTATDSKFVGKTSWAINLFDNIGVQAVSKNTVTLTNCNVGGYKDANGNIVGESNGALAMEGVEGTTLTIIGGYYYTKESGIRIRESADIVIKNTELYFGTNSNGWGLYIEHNSNDNKDPKTYYNMGGVASLYMENVTVNSSSRGVSYQSNDGNDNACLKFMTLIDVTINVRTQSNAITLQNFSKSVAPVFTWTMSEAYDLTKGYTGDTAGYGAYLISKYTEMDATFTNVALRSTKDNAFTIEGVRTHGKDLSLTLNNCYIDGYTTAATVTYSTDITVKNTTMVSQGKHRLDGTDKQTSVIRWSSNTQNSKFVAENSTFLLKYLDAVTARALWSSNGTMTEMMLTNCTVTVEGTAGVGICRGGSTFSGAAKETYGTYTFDGCTITAPTNAIFFEGGGMTEANFIFKDCVLTNEFSSLIYCKQPANVYVEGSTLTSSYNAIQVNGNKGTPNKVTVIDSTVTSANDCGFYFDVNSNIELTIKDSTFETQKWIALFDNKTSGVTVENSTLTSKTQHVFRVDATDGLAEIRITDSELTSLANSAIYGADAAALSVYVENSDLIAKGYAGMDVRGSRDASNPAKVTVKNSYIEAATYGIVVYFAMDMTVEDSTVVSMGKGAGTNSNETAAIRFSSNTSNGSLIMKNSVLNVGWQEGSNAVYGVWSSNGTLRRLEMYDSKITFASDTYGFGIGKGGDKFNAPAKETTGVYILENCSIIAPQTAFSVTHSGLTDTVVTIKNSALVSGNGNGLNFNGNVGNITVNLIDSHLSCANDAINLATCVGVATITVTNSEIRTVKYGGIYLPKVTEAYVNVTNSYFDVQTFGILVGAPAERGEINVTNCQMKNRAADHIFTINGASKDVVMNVYGGSYVSTGTAEGRVMTLNGYARANIYGGYFEADGYCVIRAFGYSELNLYGGRYVSSSTGAEHDTWHCVICLGAGEATDPYRQAKINVYGGHYEGVDTLYQIFRNFEGRALNLYSFTAKGAQYIMTYADGKSIEMEYETAEHSYSGRTPVMYDGAQLRLVQTDKNSGGIRFATKIDKDTLDYAKFMTKNDASIVYGTIIVPLDYLMDENGNWILGDFSVASLEAAGLKYLNVVAENGIIENADGSITLLASISEIKEQNYDRKFAAIGYVKYELNGQDLYLYSAFDPANNARSLREMADAALKDTAAKQDLTYRYEVAEGVYSRYSAEQRALLAIYNNCQVVEEIVIEPTPTTAGLKRVTCATCGTYYEEIILPTTSYKVLVVGENLEENVAELEATLAGSGIPEIVVGWMDSEGAYYKQFAGIWSEMLVTPNDWDEIYVILTAEELGITEDTTAEEFAVIGEKIEAVRAEFEARFDGAKVTIYVPQMV